MIQRHLRLPVDIRGLRPHQMALKPARSALDTASIAPGSGKRWVAPSTISVAFGARNCSSASSFSSITQKSASPTTKRDQADCYVMGLEQQFPNPHERQLMRHEGRYRHGSQHFSGDAAKYSFPKAGVPIGPHHQHVEIFIGGQ